MPSSSSSTRFGLDLVRELVRTVASAVQSDADVPGEQLASVPVTLSSETKSAVAGTVSLWRTPAGDYRVGVEMPQSLFGGLWSPMRRRSFTLDEVLEVQWTSSFRGGTLVLTPMAPGAFRDLPTSPFGPVAFRVARKDRAAAERLARTVALVDLPV